MLKSTRRVEAVLRDRLRSEFDTTLPRFDVMAALARFDTGLKMSALSGVLRVSNGNVTGIVDRLAEDGHRGAGAGARRPARLAGAPYPQGRGGIRAPGCRARGVDRRTSRRFRRRAKPTCSPTASMQSVTRTSHERRRPSISAARPGTASRRSALDRPDRKNPLTFDSYAELRDWFRALPYRDDVKAVVFGSNGGNFCSGGDVHDIIGPLTKMSMKELLAFTRMTGDLVKAMLHCQQAGDRRGRRGLRRRRARSSRWPRTCASPRPRPRPRSSSPASASPAATWAPAPCCPASSVRAARRSCSIPAAP